MARDTRGEHRRALSPNAPAWARCTPESLSKAGRRATRPRRESEFPAGGVSTPTTGGPKCSISSTSRTIPTTPLSIPTAYTMPNRATPARPGRWVTVWTGDMGNSFCSSAYRLSSSSCRLGSAEAATLIDRSECHRPVPDRPDAVVLFGQADRFAGQAFADIEGPALPPDLAAMAHPADLPVGGVVRRAQPAAVGPGGGLVTPRACVSCACAATPWSPR